MTVSGHPAGTNAFTRAVTHRRLAWLFALVPLLIAGLFIGLIGEAERPSKVTDQLPAGFDSTEAAVMLADLTDGDASAAITLWTADDGTLTPAQINELCGLVDGSVIAGECQPVGGQPLIVSEKGDAAYTISPLYAEDSSEIRDAVADMREQVTEAAPAGVTAQLTGPAAFQSDFSEVFAGADIKLLAATAAVVAVLLIVTYRSPFLWLIPLTVVAVADRLAALFVTHVMKPIEAVAWDPSTIGILSVLVFGAGTDYALLLISRYRDELKGEDDRYVAMARALRHTGESVLFSASTVVLGTLTLLLSVFPNTRGLGLACAIGILIAAGAALFVLPAALVLFGRWIFWPRVPKVGDSKLVESKGFWHKVGQAVDRRPRSFVVGALALLAILSAGVLDMKTGLAQSEQFIETPAAVVAAERLGESFPAGTADPLQVLTGADAEEVRTVAAEVDGVASATVLRETDDISLVDVVVTAEPGSEKSFTVVEDLRAALEGYDDTHVGGGDADVLDDRDATTRDRLMIVPAVTLLVLLGLMLLLRSIVAPLILVGTVVATYGAALGLSWWVFKYVFDFPAIHQQVPLLAFLFLVALGVDYNIFLVSRAREEARRFGNRQGMLRALTATGGVITSAGILLAAVFAVLGVLPLVLLAQIGIIIFIGVLLDTLLVRTVLVPAIAITMGDKFWWPRKPEEQPRDASSLSDQTALKVDA